MAIFQGLDQEAYDRSYTDGELLRRIAGYFGRHRRGVVWAATLVSLVSLAGAGQTFVVSWGVETLAQSQSTGLIAVLTGVMFAIGIGVWLANWLRRRLQTRVIAEVVAAMRHDAFAATIKHDLAFFDEYKSGQIISRITTDTNEFIQVVQLVIELFTQVLLVIVLLIVLFYISWQLTLVLLALGPFVILLTLLFRNLARFVTRKAARSLGRVNASIQEVVTGIGIAKNFRQEAAIYQEFAQVNEQSYQVNLRRGFVLSNVFPVLNVMSSFGIAALLYWGGVTVNAGVLAVGAWYLFMSSVDRFWFPMINLAVFWSQIQSGLSASERIFALIDTESQVRQSESQPVGHLLGEIEFKRVHFRYGEQEQVLDDFSLQIAPGESVALVGHTGAGKSSIVKLITRFYEFQAGQICVDGRDIRSFDLQSYRQQLGLVSQVPFLFAGTVADNIRYARPNLTDTEIDAVARQIGQGEWLETLPQGLHTPVGERGGRLSMGQRQLVALTRVLAQQPAIFILDEATASIDPFTESQIQEAMDLILKSTTSILIAHRLSTVRSVDRILVLQKGKIIEQGSHDRLMQQGGHYAELYETYFRHQSPDFKPSPASRVALPAEELGILKRYSHD
ncbi:MAG TPA: ABC transporter ATP-binding protein [Anaerolineae bacterium]|nr:ABC transporter ATP-binding protein [Anaerolineae bacterium]HMR66887.1 ABC transporter ATP-binding protein [Anaerolineae bacterium]